MDKTIDMALLGPCIGAATTLVINKGPLQNRDEAHVVKEIHQYAFDLYFAFQAHVDAHNAQFVSEDK